MTNEETILEIKQLMRQHDWSYEFSEDQRHWRVGSSQKREILDLISKISVYYIPALLDDCVPEYVRYDWEQSIIMRYRAERNQ